jgi:hypothetical protein
MRRRTSSSRRRERGDRKRTAENRKDTAIGKKRTSQLRRENPFSLAFSNHIRPPFRNHFASLESNSMTAKKKATRTGFGASLAILLFCLFCLFVFSSHLILLCFFFSLTLDEGFLRSRLLSVRAGGGAVDANAVAIAVMRATVDSLRLGSVRGWRFLVFLLFCLDFLCFVFHFHTCSPSLSWNGGQFAASLGVWVALSGVPSLLSFAFFALSSNFTLSLFHLVVVFLFDSFFFCSRATQLLF